MPHATLDSTWRAPGRWRKRTTDRKRRVLVKWLRRTANYTDPPPPLARRRQTLLSHRAGAVRSELLEVASALEHNLDPNPTSLTELHQLLANGCDSPLYNPEIHVSELHAAVHYLKRGFGVTSPSRIAAAASPRVRTSSFRRIAET